MALLLTRHPCGCVNYSLICPAHATLPAPTSAGQPKQPNGK